jgi:ectoine hydroxylase-related dioxygenase (phytanoyl-CoA dioxygenase family)
MEYRMTPEEDYVFDVSGYLILKKVLSQDEVNRHRASIEAKGSSGQSALSDAFQNLRDHPALVSCVRQLVGENAILDRGPCLLKHEDQNLSLNGGNEPREASRSYYQKNQVRFCQGLKAVWALSDLNPGDGGLVLVPASHKGQVAPPPELLNGTEDLGVVNQPSLEAGDLLLLVESLIHGVQPCKSNATPLLVAFEYSAEKAARGSKPKDPPPDWLDELNPEQKVVMAGSGQPDAATILKSNGRSCVLENGAGVYHPSTLAPDPDCGIDSREFFLWDLCGHLVLRNVMDSGWLASANSAIDASSDRIKVGGSPANGSNILGGTGVPSLHGLLELPKPHCDPFRKMIADPAVVQRLTWMMGSGFLLRNIRAICSVKGTAGHRLHSGAEPVRPSNGYLMQNGRAYCEAVNVAWQLHEVGPADGGFMCIPGSHRAGYPLPPSFINCDETRYVIRHVELAAGDVVLFLAGAQTHGAYPWTSDKGRRAVLIGYGSRNMA